MNIPFDDLYQKLVIENKTYNQIAKELNIKVNSVIWYAQKYKLKQGTRSKTLNEDLLIELLINQNLPITQVASQLKVSRGLVYRHITKYGIKKTSYKVTVPKEWLYEEYITKNRTKEEIAKDHTNRNVSASVIARNIREYDLIKTIQKHQEAIQKTKIKNGSSITLGDLPVSYYTNKFGIAIGTVKTYWKINPYSTIKQAEDYFRRVNNGVTDIEQCIESAFGFTHFNKKPKDLKVYRKPDFKVKEDLYLNVDGLYWHSEAASKLQRYHYKLRQDFEDSNLRILQFRADEILDPCKFSIVKSMINNHLNKSLKIYARKTQIKKVKSKIACEFLKENHLMGKTSAKHLGLYSEEVLVCLFSYKLIKGVLKVERFCNKKGLSIYAGFSKLLKYAELETTPTSVEYWVDLRYGTGDYLKNLDFIHEKTTLGWKWTDYINTYNRLYCRANMDDRKLSEREYAKELKLVKIYDAGQAKFRKYLK